MALPAGATRPKARTSETEELARTVVREVESKGVDCVAFARRLKHAALEHDARYPKCVFVECSQAQADDFAAAAQRVWGRSVIGVDLNRLQEDDTVLPPAIRFVVTTRWHIAEVKKLLRKRTVHLREVSVRPARRFLDGLARLAGAKTGLVLRDPESVAGFRKLIQKHVKVKGRIPAAVTGEPLEARGVLQTLEAVVFTAPAREFITHNTPRGVVKLELLCEPIPEDLTRIQEELFLSP